MNGRAFNFSTMIDGARNTSQLRTSKPGKITATQANNLRTNILSNPLHQVEYSSGPKAIVIQSTAGICSSRVSGACSVRWGLDAPIILLCVKEKYIYLLWKATTVFYFVFADSLVHACIVAPAPERSQQVLTGGASYRKPDRSRGKRGRSQKKSRVQGDASSHRG